MGMSPFLFFFIPWAVGAFTALMVASFIPAMRRPIAFWLIFLFVQITCMYVFAEVLL